MRKIITIVLGIILIAAGIFIARTLANNERQQRPQQGKVVPTVFIDTVRNTDVPVEVIESGRLIAKNRIELFSEVQGVMEPNAKEFKPGVRYNKGEILVRIRDEDFYANLQGQKSNLQNLITSILPDLRLDFPDAYTKWDDYIRNFDMDKPVQPLPETTSEKEKFFITGRNIYTTYYNTKNSEIIWRKYNLIAPFSGILTEAVVTPGTLIRQGQKLGEFIDPTIYELEVAISKTFMPNLSVGHSVIIRDTETSGKEWNGKIVRINGKVDPSTQTVQVFIQLTGRDLREGMYLEAVINGQKEKNAYELNRSLVVDQTKLYVVRDNILDLVTIDPVYTTQRTIIVRGLNDGDQVLTKAIPGAYAGMEVKILTDNTGRK